jgi:hypothetical protein
MAKTKGEWDSYVMKMVGHKNLYMPQHKVIMETKMGRVQQSLLRYYNMTYVLWKCCNMES